MNSIFAPIAYVLAAGIAALSFGAGYQTGQWRGHHAGIEEGRALCEADHDKASLEAVDQANRARRDAMQRELGGVPEQDPFRRD